ncbi:amino acid adenylation domain-containing protein [Saccharothrix longispora]|uniref:Amino acid adenylation domain-containing protein n=1 Tax=Saccharothrix longispora TaxID=33920 RepID=A0ABU1PTL0_9PSEU|nr:amino acid adenylation domain-containing protein [Saccharothrix longispora]MDR6593995.1 amino acid adenylation domain-containing protein [Saccharothrix longispora]
MSAPGTFVFPASFGQERLWMLHEMGAGSAYHVVGGLRLTGRLDVDALRAAFQVLVDRHEALRTGVRVGQGGAVVQVATDALPVPFTTAEHAASELDDVVRAIVAEPFDLAEPPLLRAVLMRVVDAPEPRWLLVLCVHHVVVDGWSLGILLTELSAAYSALVVGAEPALPEPEVQYADFAVWQREHLSGDDVAGQREFWRGALAGVQALDLPTDRPRGADRGHGGDVVRAVLPAALLRRLAATAQAEGVTDFMVFVTAWTLVLSRWSGQDDVVIGTPVTGRPSDELDGVVGFFVNTLPLRVRLDPLADVRDLLRRCRSVCLDALANQDLPFEWLKQEAGAATGPAARLPQAMLAYQNTPPGDLRLPGVDVEPVQIATGSTQFDVGLYLAPAGDGLGAELVFATDLFDTSSARRLLDAFTLVLDGLPGHLASPLWTVPVTSPEEVARVDALGGSPEPPEPPPSITGWFEETARRTPDAVAVVADGTGEELTYAELADRSDRVAAWLRAHGVGPEVPVGVCLERGVDLAVAVLGLLKAGGAYLPLDPDWPDARLRAVVAEARPGVVLVSTGTRGRAVGDDTADVATAAAHDAAGWVRPDVPGACAAFVVFTSGSTGMPKGAVNTLDGLANRLRAMAGAIPLGPADVVVQKTPIGFDVAVPELLGPLVAGARLVFAVPGGHRDPDYLVDLFARRGVTRTHFVPSMLRAFLGSGVTGARVPALRHVQCSGEELSAALAADFTAAFPDTALHNAYGPAETAVEVTHHRVDGVAGRLPIGGPLPGVRLLVLDRHGRPAPLGVPGELHIAGVHTGRGYLGRPRLTAAAFVPHEGGARLYRSGDLARWNDDGTLTFLGRRDHQVKIRGQRVEPEEVEHVLRGHPAVTDATVVVRSDPTGSAQLVAYVVPAGPDAPGVDEVRRFAGERLPAVMVPSRVVPLERLPVNANGKVDRAALPPPPAEASGASAVAPRTPVETLLAKLWSEVLGTAEVGVTDDFYELGGDSLRAVNLLQRTRALGFEFPLATLLGRHTIEELAELADRPADEVDAGTTTPGVPAEARR